MRIFESHWIILNSEINLWLGILLSRGNHELYKNKNNVKEEEEKTTQQVWTSNPLALKIVFSFIKIWALDYILLSFC
mgnify:CR=1 FL=1